MPYINVNTSKKLTEEKKNTLKQKLGELIAIIPGKSESVLMIKLNDEECIYYSGILKDNAAFVDIKIKGSAAFEIKKELTESVFRAFGEQLGIDAADMFITISEFENWGFQGTLL